MAAVICKKREYDQELPQLHTDTNPQHREEEPQNTNSHKASGK